MFDRVNQPPQTFKSWCRAALKIARHRQMIQRWRRHLPALDVLNIPARRQPCGKHGVEISLSPRNLPK
jgi:hypothetical protein